MLTLHGFGSKFGLFDPSPFVTKVDCYLRMANIEYRFDTDPNNLKKAPKGKLPFIVQDGSIVADSQMIFNHLAEQHDGGLDAALTPSQKAQAYLITKSLDENLYFCLVYSRWLCDDTWPLIKKAFFGFLPPVMRSLVPAMVRNSVAKGLKGQGITRHSHQEILAICQQNLQALSCLLENKQYFFDDKPSSLDASCFGHLSGFVLSDIDNPFTSMARELTPLVDYCKNIDKAFY